MSTKQSILYGDQYHLYSDVLDSMGDGDSVVSETPLYLELSDCPFEASTTMEHQWVKVCIPHDIAVALGLIPTPHTSTEGQS